MLNRRDFVKLIAPATLASVIFSNNNATAPSTLLASAPDGYGVRTPFYRLGLARSMPEIRNLGLDSLGKGNLSINSILPQLAEVTQARYVLAASSTAR